tara:strand:- start:10074 stop:11657 length:1584 start_codon:yes stop_codon:yes gene_type:complete
MVNINVDPIKEFFIKLFFIIKKDLRVLTRSKASALVIILGPLVLILLVGMAFNTSSLYDIKLDSYSESYSDLTESLIVNLRDQQYSINKIESEDNCLSNVKSGETHVCIIFPKDMNIESENEIIFYVDESRVNLAAIISNTIFAKVATKAEELSSSLAGQVLGTISSVKVENEKTNTLVTELKEDNSNINVKVKGVRDDFFNLDLTYNATLFNFTGVDDEIDEIKSDLNLSGGQFRRLEGVIEDLKLEVELLGTRFDTANEKRAGFIANLDGARSSMIGFVGKLNTLQDSVDTVKNSVGGVTVTNVETIVSPLKTSVRPITNEEVTHLSFLFPTLIALIVMFISILFSANTIIREKRSKAYFRNFITPTNEFTLMIGSFLTNIILVFVELVILFGVALYFFKEELLNVLPILTIALIVISSVFIFIGMFIGHLFRSGETSLLAAIGIAFFMLFFSNTILPIESLPSYIANIVKFNPFIIAESIVKQVILFGANLATIAEPLYFLIGGAVLFFVLTFISRELTRRSVA